MLTSFSSSPPRPPPSPVRNFIHRILSYDSNIMLAAIISLLLVILFVLLLHIYAKWFLVARYRRSRSSVAHVPHVLGARFHLDTNTYTPTSSPVKGISRSLISTIPSFVYRGVNDQPEKGLECTICLSLFEDEEICRKLPSCKHAFHVDCIDMWLYSHSTCPICRAPIVHDLIKKTVELENEDRRSTSSLGDTQQETISTVEIIVEVPILGRVDNENILNVDDPLSVCSSSSSSSCSSLTSSLSGSLKRMLSRNSSERRKVPPSTTIN